MSEVDFSEFRAAFLGEAEELLTIANHELLAIEAALRTGEGHTRSTRELFRAIHTMKGLSAMVGIEPIVVISHRLESVLRDVNNGQLKLMPPAVDTMLEAVRAIALRVQSLTRGGEVTMPPAALLEALEALEANAIPRVRAIAPALKLGGLLEEKLGSAEREQLTDGVRKGQRAVQLEFVPSPARAEQGVNITSVRQRLAEISDIVKVIPRSAAVSDDSPGGLSFVIVALTTESDERLAACCAADAASILTLSIADEPTTDEPATDETEDVGPRGRSLVRVEIARIDEAMNRMSVLIVTRYRLQRAVRALADKGVAVRELEQILADHGRELRDLRAAILSVRMVTMEDVLDRIPLLVRGLARTTGKQVRLELDVGDTEVDKAVAERIFPAIVHLVRNAVDHAIETPAERLSRGKPDKGLIRIVCVERSSTQLELTVQDDGGGVDAAVVATRSGRELPNTDEELLALLCLPGMSTRTETTTTSGRGMGMDIVRSVVVDQLGGELTLATTPGVGSTFTLRVPLTVSIVDAFTFESGHERYAVPVSLVEEVLEIDPGKIVYAPGARRTAMMEWRGHALPVVVLSQLLGRPVERVARNAFVARRNGDAIVFAVERLLGQQEVVVRPLEDALVRVPGITGSTDLGDGRPTLVVDLHALGGRLASRRVA
ncbi:MAG: chemotaxis protein CheW [Polyangia bacterium]